MSFIHLKIPTVTPQTLAVGALIHCNLGTRLQKLMILLKGFSDLYFRDWHAQDERAGRMGVGR